MYYPDEVIDEVRLQNDIVDVIGQYVALKKKGGTYFGLCPFHNEKTPSFSVTREKQMYYCFGCGKGGNVITFLKDYENYTFPEAVQALAERAGIRLPEKEESEEDRRRKALRDRILEVNKKAALYFYHQLKSERGKRAHDYFVGRGLSEETIVKFGLGYSNPYRDDLYRAMKKEGYEDGLLAQTGLFTIDERGAFDKFWNRAMFPIMDANKKVIAFGGRVMGEGEPKYLNSPETMIFDKSRNLYGLHLARSTRRDFFLVCEGYMDVIALHQAGFDNAVAALGTAFTPQHANLLRRFTSQVVLTLDSDGAGQKAALRAIPILRSAGLSVRVLDMKPHKDPDEFIKTLGAEAYEQRIESAENFFLFEIRKMRERYDLSDPEQLTQFHRGIARRLLEFPEELERNNYLEAACRAYQIQPQQMKQLVVRMAARGYVPEPAEEPVRPAPVYKKKEKDGGLRQSQAILLTWLAEYPALYRALNGRLSPEDFSEGVYRRAAQLLWEQLAQGPADPARIIDRFAEDEEQYNEAAALFQARIDDVDSAQARVKAAEDAYRRVRRARLEQETRSADLAGLQKLLKQQEALKSFRLRPEDVSL